MNLQKTAEFTEIQNLLELRIFAYDILRKVFLAEPTKELVAQLLDGIINFFPFNEEDLLIKEGIEQVSNYFQTFDMDKNFDGLHWDYTKMFIGPYKIQAPIWESAYLNREGLLFAEETLVVRRLYLQYNLLSAQYRIEADDHLGLELDFMYQLSTLANNHAQEENSLQLQKVFADQCEFLKEHLLKWIPSFSNKVIKHAETDFYKGMVKILNGFLTIDKIGLEELLTSNKQ